MSARQLTIAVVGATGAVGEALLAVLAEREFPIGTLYLVGSGENPDDTAMFAERPLRVDVIDDFDFGRCQIAFFCAPAAVAKKYAPIAAEAGCWVIDTSCQFRLDRKVPLVVPSVNGDALADLATPQIIASPAAHVVQAATVLAPLQKKFGLNVIDVTAMLAVSALGKRGANELAGQTARLLNAQPVKKKQQVFASRIAFNLVPAFDAQQESGYTLEETEAAAEIKKLLKDEQLEVGVSLIFVPVFYGHSQILQVETKQSVTPALARTQLKTETSIKLARSNDNVISAVDVSGGNDVVHVGRIAQPTAAARRLTVWSVTDNVRKGAAVNSVEIAETLLESHL